MVVEEEWPGFEALPPTPPTEWPEGWPRVLAPPEPPLPDPSPRRRWSKIAAVALLAAVIVLAVTRIETNDPGEIASPATVATLPEFSPPPGPQSSTTTTAAPDPGPLQAEVAALSAFVERERGLAFTGGVAVEVLSDEEFRARVDEQWPIRADQGREALLKALGAIAMDVPYADQLHDLRLEYTEAFYRPDNDTLVLRDGEVDDRYRSILVHELTHALDDQWFDLVRPQYADADDEIAFGFKAVVEGDATRVEHAYIDALPPDQRWERQPGSSAAPPGIDPVVADALWNPYDLGEALVSDVLDELGQAGLDAAFVDPPTTSEQVRYPAKYIDREGRLPVSPPPSDGPVVADGVMGLMLTEAMLSPLLEPERARVAAAGWGGDWYVSWLIEDNTMQCWRTDYAMDSDPDRTELLTALRTWVANGPQRTVEFPSTTTVRVTACGPPAPNGGDGEWNGNRD